MDKINQDYKQRASNCRPTVKYFNSLQYQEWYLACNVMIEHYCTALSYKVYNK